MRRLLLVLLVLLWSTRADAHVGSPDVFFEGDAGPYHLFVTIRVPQVIPGIATIEIRSSSPDVAGLSVVPMRLTGPGSELPPTSDAAVRSADDPQFFTASLWLMERGSLQVRIAATGARGDGTLAVPVPAMALRTLAMDRGLGSVLFGLMVLLAVSLVSIIGAAVREATLPPDAPLPSRRRMRIAIGIASVLVVGILAAGNAWWSAEAGQYERTIFRGWKVEARVESCRVIVPAFEGGLLPDHGHEMHLFLIKTPGADHLLHLHPQRTDGKEFAQDLPSLPAGHYQLFADVVFGSGFPLTGAGTLELPELTCPDPTGDDTAWAGAPLQAADTTTAKLTDGSMVWDRPAAIRANVAMPFRFHVLDRDGKPAADLEPYMGMVAHAEFVRDDMTVFAHVHPEGSIAMPALDLARTGLDRSRAMPGMDMAMPGMVHAGEAIAPAFALPYGFPRPGTYRIFVQIKRAGQIETGAFDVHVAE